MSSSDFDIAKALHQAGRLAEAERLYRSILLRHPDDAKAIYFLGLLAEQTRHSPAAIDLLTRAVELDPSDAKAGTDLAIVLCNAGRFGKAVAACQRVIAMDPDWPAVHVCLGNSLRKLNRLEESAAAFRKAVHLNPMDGIAWNNLGEVLSALGQIDEALAACERAVQLAGAVPEVQTNLGNVLRDAGRTAEAVAAYQRAIQLNPQADAATIGLAGILGNVGRPDEAIALYREVLEKHPNWAAVHCGLGHMLMTIAHTSEAMDCYAEARRIDPGFRDAWEAYLGAMLVSPDSEPGEIFTEHVEWDNRFARPLWTGAPHENSRDPDRRLKIGYVSSEFRSHVIGWNLHPLLSAHDHAPFEIFCYSAGIKRDAVTDELRSHADVWRDISRLNDRAAADLIRRDGIDILVELALHTPGNRLLIFAEKPAPVQVTYLGYCGTSGMRAMDWRFSDRHLDPIDEDELPATEQTWRLPRTYWCYGPGGEAPPEGNPPAVHSGRIMFGCLNDSRKLSAEALQLWEKILDAVKNSRLILGTPRGAHREILARRFGADRLEMVSRAEWATYMQTYHRIDIALDPFPYNGGITTCDALWMGVPVVTLSGRMPMGRAGRSILNAVGMGELVASTAEDYLRNVVELAADIPQLAEMRRTLRERMRTSPLMDAPAFARDVEEAYRSIWRRWCESGS